MFVVQGETLPQTSRLCAASTTLRTGLTKEWSELCILGTPRRTRRGAQSTLPIASSIKYSVWLMVGFQQILATIDDHVVIRD